MQSTFWTEYFKPDASSDRGWLKALTEPYDRAKYHDYTSATMPVFDDEVPGQWREQSTLGNYLDYCDCFQDAERIANGSVHAICYVTNTSRYVRTVAEAREWIEQEALRFRPSLAIQAVLDLEVTA